MLPEAIDPRKPNLLDQLGLGQGGMNPDETGVFTRMLDEYNSANSDKPKYPDEAINDPNLLHQKVETQSTDTTGNIPLIQAPQQPQQQASLAPTPRIPAPTQPPVPSVGSNSSAPLIDPRLASSQGELGRAQAERDRLIQTGSGISQIHNPILRTLARIADIGGTMLFPAAPMVTPGTELHHSMLIRGADSRINQAQNEITSETEAQHRQAETENLGEPAQPKTPDEVVLHDLMTGNNGSPRINPQTGKPYTYLEAYSTVKQAAQDVKPDKEDQKLLRETTTTPELANKMFQRRWEILNAGKSLPPEMTLNPDATVADFKRVDKQLQDLVNAEGTKAQRDTANALRREGLNNSEARLKDAQNKISRETVFGTEPGTNRVVMVSEDEANKRKLTDVMKPPTPQVDKVWNARQWIDLATSRNADDPDDKSILELIHDLDKKGEMGAVLTRWQDFLNGTLGTGGDPEFEQLREKVGLAKTLLMNVHVGNRGGAYMFEHFEDLSNAKKMDAKTLEAGIKSEINYAKHRAMLPSDHPNSYNSSENPSSGAPQSTTRDGRPATKNQPMKTKGTLTKDQVQTQVNNYNASHPQEPMTLDEAIRDAQMNGYEVK